MISLKKLLEADMPKKGSQIPAPAPITAQAPVKSEPSSPPSPEQKPSADQQSSATGQDDANEYSPSFDFNNFQTNLAQTTETTKNNFQNKLLQRVNGKKVTIRASKGQPGQPLKDYTINVRGVNVDYYYDKYVVIFKDEDEKEYFLNPMIKIKILGQADAPLPSTVSTKKPEQSKIVPQEKVPNTVTQGL